MLLQGEYNGLKVDTGNLSNGEDIGLYGGLACEASSGSNYCTEANTLFRAMNPQPPTSDKKIINSTIKALKAAGIWSKTDLLHMYAQGTAQQAALNWVNPVLNTATLVNSPVFTSYRGYSGNGSLNGYVNTNFTLTAGTNFINGSHNLAIYIRKFELGNKVVYGATTASTSQSIQGQTVNANASINDENVGFGAITIGIGLISQARQSTTDYVAYARGSQINSSSTSSAGLPNRPSFVLARNDVGGAFNPCGAGTEIGCYMLSGYLTPSQNAMLSVIINNYMTYYSANVY